MGNCKHKHCKPCCGQPHDDGYRNGYDENYYDGYGNGYYDGYNDGYNGRWGFSSRRCNAVCNACFRTEGRARGACRICFNECIPTENAG